MYFRYTIYVDKYIFATLYKQRIQAAVAVAIPSGQYIVYIWHNRRNTNTYTCEHRTRTERRTSCWEVYTSPRRPNQNEMRKKSRLDEIFRFYFIFRSGKPTALWSHAHLAILYITKNIPFWCMERTIQVAEEKKENCHFHFVLGVSESISMACNVRLCTYHAYMYKFVLYIKMKPKSENGISTLPLSLSLGCCCCYKV